MGLVMEVGSAGTLMAHGNTDKLMTVAMAVDAAAPDDMGVADLVLAKLGPGLALTAHLRGIAADGQAFATQVWTVTKRPEEHAILDSLLRVALARPGMERWRCPCGKVHRATHVRAPRSG
jgi:hypothetical protein